MSSVVAFEPQPAAAPGEPLIRLEGVSVRYRLPREPIYSIRQYVIRRLKGRIGFHEFWALRQVSLEVHRGEILGIIGRNGAGKSTLLKVLAQILRPTKGRVRVRGTVAAMLDLGAGFDMELSGRENIFLNGAILGHRIRDIKGRLDRIVDFAGLRDFIDMPLRTYSSGMMARLGFAIATDVLPEILILDEVLAVGDAEFMRKSVARMHALCRHGEAVVLVSHGLDTIRALCNRVAWLDHGELRALGPADLVVEEYLRAVSG